MKINQYPNAPELNDANLLLLETSAGTKTTTLQKLAQFFSPKKLGVLPSNTKASDIGGLMDQSGAAFANSFIHEYDLGNRFTEAQSADIRSGAFKLVRVGGYWNINGHKYWAAHADYRLHTGNKSLTNHHMLVIPDQPMFKKPMNLENTISGGYAGSNMKKNSLNEALNIVSVDFGSAHILPYDISLSNAASSGSSTGCAWYTDQKIDLMNECMVMGCNGYSRDIYDIGNDKSQLALFSARPDLIVCKSGWYWMRNIVGNTYFSRILPEGDLNNASASRVEGGVRPAFLIY